MTRCAVAIGLEECSGTITAKQHKFRLVFWTGRHPTALNCSPSAGSPRGVKTKSNQSPKMNMVTVKVASGVRATELADAVLVGIARSLDQEHR